MSVNAVFGCWENEGKGKGSGVCGLKLEMVAGVGVCLYHWHFLLYGNCLDPITVRLLMKEEWFGRWALVQILEEYGRVFFSFWVMNH